TMRVTNIIAVNFKWNSLADNTGIAITLGLFINPNSDQRAIHLAYSPAVTHSAPNTKPKSQGPNRNTIPYGIIPTAPRDKVAFFIKRFIFSPLLAASEIRG